MYVRMYVKIYSTVVFELGMGKRNQKDGGTIVIKKYRSGNRTRWSGNSDMTNKKNKGKHDQKEKNKKRIEYTKLKRTKEFYLTRKV